MSKNFNTNTTNCETWLTPPGLIKALGKFDLDPCTPANMPWRTAKKMLSFERDGDGLAAEWKGRVWCNPPYGKKTFDWLAKLADHKSGIALIFARTETKGFQSEVLRKAHCLFFLEGRLKFHRADGTQGGTANAPSVLVSYSLNDTKAIFDAAKRGDIRGVPAMPTLSYSFFLRKQVNL